MSLIDPLGLATAVCIADNTSGSGYENGRKVCDYTCTVNGRTLKTKGGCNKIEEENICYGVPIAGRTANRSGTLRIETGEPRNFSLDTNSFIDRHIRFDSRLLDGISQQLGPKR